MKATPAVAFAVYLGAMLHLLMALVVFYTLHSLLAATAAKRWAAQRLGLQRWYRLLYTLQSLLLLAWVWWAHAQLPAEHLLPVASPWFAVVGWSLLVGGALLAAFSVLRLGGAGFIGITEERHSGLVRSGLHGRVRHPIYTGIILAAVGWLLLAPTGPNLLVVGVTFLYLPFGIHLEERKLIDVFGEDYQRYRREVPALCPRLGKA
jgi:protein-S-isoprenylcysteine O-methyltransferase Ste14